MQRLFHEVRRNHFTSNIQNKFDLAKAKESENLSVFLYTSPYMR